MNIFQLLGAAGDIASVVFCVIVFFIFRRVELLEKAVCDVHKRLDLVLLKDKFGSGG